MSKSKRTQETKPQDLSHAPGHRRLEHQASGETRHGGNSPQNASALNSMSRSDVMQRTERRDIAGGAIGNKGHGVGRTPMGGRGK